MVEQTKWLVPALLLEPAEAHIGYYVCYIPLHRPASTAVRLGTSTGILEDKLRIVVETLTRKDSPIVKPRGAMIWTRAEVPFAVNRRRVSGLLQELRKGRELIVHRSGQGRHAVHMVMSSGEDRRPAWGANGVGAETVVKSHPAGCDPIQVGSLVDAATVTPDCMSGMIIAHDEHDIRSVLQHVIPQVHHLYHLGGD